MGVGCGDLENPAEIAALPGSLDIEWYQGDGASMTVVLKDSDGSPLQLDGYSAAMHIRKGPKDLYPVVEAEAVVDIPDPSNGTLEVSVPASVMSGLNGLYRYDLQVTVDDSPRTVLVGSLSVTSEVTA